MRRRRVLIMLLGIALTLGLKHDGSQARQQDEVIPHGQDQPPNPAKSPEEALDAMTVPEGFTVELVAHEPDLVNPVAMTFDEKGRIWVTESFEYPRREPGPGRDRVKVLEDTNGDGTADKVTTFAEGLNIPSGIAVGHGGVWVANAPDILFYPNADGDLTPDGPPEVVVTGFGRDDTHELPNSLTWGPDGWLYGWNGVFNPSKVEHNGKTYEFTCAVFRIHPVTRDFELFSEGTSNPWGIAFDPEGSMFASACVIDHLWHMVETGYYHRQGGPYPPFTWKIESIVDHTHQKRAYCGLTYFDSDAYPPEYRDKLYMGNIHGGCINVDELERRASTYHAKPRPDFLTANDAWFMPVVQKTGPDGCLYVLDWYDRYHCYQDANRDPEGINRSKGRLYRVRFEDTPRRFGFNLANEDNKALIKMLDSPNIYDRDIAQRLLTERLISEEEHPDLREQLETAVRSGTHSRKGRMHAVWSLVSSGTLALEFHRALLDHDDANFRAWGVRAAGNMGQVEPEIREKVAEMAADPSPDVRLQAVIAARKVEGIDPLPIFVEVLSQVEDDPLVPRVVWQNLHPLLDDGAADFVAGATQRELPEDIVTELHPRVIERILGGRDPDPAAIAELVALLALGENGNEDAARRSFEIVANQVRNGQIAGERLERLTDEMRPVLASLLAEEPPRLLIYDALLMAATWRDPLGQSIALGAFQSHERPEAQRLQALQSVVAGVIEPIGLLDVVKEVLADREANSAEFRGRVLAALGPLEHPHVAQVVLDLYPDLEPELKPRAVDLLTQRTSWSRALLHEVGREWIAPSALNVNQIRKLQTSSDEEVVALVRETWGTVREDRNPAREEVIKQMRDHLQRTNGDPFAGRQVFDRVCAQCHQMYGEGQEVGPDLTGNGRGSLEQLLSNVFDPNLVIGTAYQATTVATTDGRILTGLLAEDSPQRIILKVEGGNIESIARDQVEEMKISEVSLMPENLEEQLTPQEIADLFAFLSLDRPPSDPESQPIPGAEVLKIGRGE